MTNRHVDPYIAKLMDDLFSLFSSESLDSLALVRCLRAIAEQLNESAHDNPKNCVAVDDYVMRNMIFNERAQHQIARLPPDLQLLIEDMGMNLHDAHSAPDVARMFDSMPEQLVLRACDIERRLYKSESQEGRGE